MYPESQCLCSFKDISLYLFVLLYASHYILSDTSILGKGSLINDDVFFVVVVVLLFGNEEVEGKRNFL